MVVWLLVLCGFEIRTHCAQVVLLALPSGRFLWGLRKIEEETLGQVHISLAHCLPYYFLGPN